ncbi:hypothetical protein Shyhy02_72190 [Streptomyces hygroscopicus subsp. hygroscopicus]|nr:hypothetical protein Shyhy02_72190 [Streptomyces hygroscopicus subsp. hygroscopicus]
MVVKEAGPNRHGSGRPPARLRQPRERGGGGASAQISGYAVQNRPPALPIAFAPDGRDLASPQDRRLDHPLTDRLRPLTSESINQAVIVRA